MTQHAPHADQLAALAEIATRARSLQDRLTDGQESCEDSPHLQEWAKQAAGGDARLFERLLEWDGLPRERAAAAVDVSLPCPNPRPLPRWLGTLQAAYGWAGSEPPPAPVGEDKGRDPAHAGGKPAFGFEEVLLPLVHFARARVQRIVGDAYGHLRAGAHASLERALLEQLSKVCCGSLMVRFSVFRQRDQQEPTPREAGVADRRLYLAFVNELLAGGMLAFFREHSVAARLCATATDFWIESSAEFIQRLSADRQELGRRFADGNEPGAVTELQASLSDPHSRGRTVLVLQFESGLRLVYKPRSMGVDAFLADLLDWMNRSGQLLPLQAPAVLARDDYGWVGFISHLPCGGPVEVQEFYRRSGMLLAIVHLLNGSDFHVENLIASGAHPHLVDLETLLGQRFQSHGIDPGSAGGSAATLMAKVDESVLRIHLLPFVKTNDDGPVMEIGGLASRTAQAEDLVLQSWVDLNTDLMRLEPRRARIVRRYKNLPVLDGQPVPALDYVEDIVGGFQQAYQFFLDQRRHMLAPDGILASLGPQPVRFILRNTSLYGTMLTRTLHPNFLRLGVERSLQFQVLARTFLHAGANRPPIWPILAAEHAALEQMDVPLFASRADSRDLVLPDGRTLVDCFAASAKEEVLRKVRGLSPEGCAEQVSLIRAAFATAAAHGLRNCEERPRTQAGAALDRASLLEAARGEASRLADELRAASWPLAEFASWPGPVYVSRTRKYAAGAIGPTLFDGAAGVGLALAAVSVVTGRDEDAALARLALRPLRDTWLYFGGRLKRGTVDAGLGTGIGSAIYALLRSGRMLQDTAMIQAAGELAGALSAEDLHPDAPDDLLTGRAGALLALVVSHQEIGGDLCLDRARQMAQALLARRQRDAASGLQIWMNRRTRAAEIGMAHGQSGIALALLRLHAVTADAEFIDAAAEAMEYERRILGARLEGTAEHNASAAWIQGAAGIALARAAAVQVNDAGPIRADLEAAAHLTEQGLLDGSDNLSGGALGRIEALMAAARVLGRADLEDVCRAAAARMLADARRDGRYRLGWSSGYQAVGLFQGLAGIAYSWARLCAPERVPNVLSWE